MEGPQRGYCVGDDKAPDRYQLERPIRQGGEGDVWQAALIRQDGTDELPWAIKIIDARRLITSYDETLDSALETWHSRLQRALDETAHLHADVPGIVSPSRVFIGDEPHPAGEPVSGRALYVVSPWVDGSDLEEWRRERKPSLRDICDVLAKLAVIIDAMAYGTHPVIHRDISPSNVMVRRKDGQVRLIDFTFARPPNSAAGTVVVLNRGYTAPEARAGLAAEPADRYSFGAVAYYLLTRIEPAIEDAATEGRAVLIRDGFGADIADHVVALLNADPQARPARLTEWTRRLSELTQRAPAPAQYRTLTLTIDGTHTPVVTAAGAEGVSTARLGVGLTWRLAHDDAAPAAVRALAAVTEGSGTQVTLVMSDDGTVFTGRLGRWSRLNRAVADGGLAAVRNPQGLAMAFVVDPAEHELATIALDGTARLVKRGRPVRRVLSATTDRDGSWVALVLLPDGDLACVSSEGANRVGDGSAFAAAGCLDQWGELRCYRIRAEETELSFFGLAAGHWDLAGSVQMPSAATAVACAGHRQGVTVAVAGNRGLHVATHDDSGFSPWQTLTDQPCTQIVLDTGAAWRLRLAALVRGRAVLATEGFDGRWPMGLTIL